MTATARVLGVSLAAARALAGLKVQPVRSMVKMGSLFGDLPTRPLAEEAIDVLLKRAPVRIERIVSTGQITPEEKWYDQDADEWVLLVSGAARLRIEGETEDRVLEEGGWILLPAHCRHRVTWTMREPPTVWLAIHLSS
jgi:cupin 2 domain-containing protein